MFRRKEEAFDFEGEENEVAQGAPATGAPQQSSSPMNAAPSPASSPATPAVEQRTMAQAPSNPAPRAPIASATPAFRPAGAPASATAQSTPSTPSNPAPRQAAQPSTTPVGSAANNAAKSSKRILTVGNDILLKGEIATCDRLVIEGAVDATLKDVHTVEIAETGSFKGTAEIEDAEISGIFEGTLVVRNRLTIYATGKVRGKISYGEVEIERGGQLTGEINIQGQGAAVKKDTKAA